MATDKDINHYLDREDWNMERAEAVSESIDVVPFLDHIYMDMKLWGDFVRAARRAGVDIHAYLSIALKQEVENALKYDLLG